MNVHVSVGSSQDFRLSRVLLVYGISSYDGFPYRHPFITAHEVIHEEEEARLGAGQLVTPDSLRELTSGLGQTVPVEILPERVLVRTPETIVWWSPAQVRTMFFSDRSQDKTLRQLNGKKYPHPALLFKTTGTSLWVRALAENQRPSIESAICVAPYWNCSEDGMVCNGNMRTPPNHSIEAIAGWEAAFFQSEFTHAGAAINPVQYRRGFLAMWQLLQGKTRFPNAHLRRTKETLMEFVRNHDPAQRN